MTETKSLLPPAKRPIRAIKEKPVRLRVYFDSEHFDRDAIKRLLQQWGSVWNASEDEALLLIVDMLIDPAEVLKYINSMTEDSLLAAILAQISLDVAAPKKGRKRASK